jgi:hypothetical protein
MSEIMRLTGLRRRQQKSQDCRPITGGMQLMIGMSSEIEGMEEWL